MFDEEKVNSVLDERFEQLKRNEDTVADKEGIVTIEGERYNIMGAEYFMARMLEMLEEIYGQGAGGIIQNAGEEYGKELSPDEVEDPQRAFGRILGHLKFLGYGHIYVEDDQVVLEDSPTAENYSGDSVRSCYFVSGVLTAATREIFEDDEVILDEEKCKTGESERCHFTP